MSSPAWDRRRRRTRAAMVLRYARRKDPQGYLRLVAVARRLPEAPGPYYFDTHANPVGLAQWSTLLQYGGERARRVALTVLGVPPDAVEVSTVWLGLDHSWGVGAPLIYESMVFGGPLDEVELRYSTRTKAQRGHDALVAAVRTGESWQQLQARLERLGLA